MAASKHIPKYYPGDMVQVREVDFIVISVTVYFSNIYYNLVSPQVYALLDESSKEHFSGYYVSEDKINEKKADTKPSNKQKGTK